MAIALTLEGKRNWTYGDSNLYGVAASPLSNRWSNLIAIERNGEDYNIGVPGQGWLNPGNLFVKENVEVYNPANCKYIWLCNGTNDLGVTKVEGGVNVLITGAEFGAKLLEIVDYIQANKGWSYASMVLPTINVRYDINYGQRLLDFNEAIRQVAELRGCIYIDLYTQFVALPNQSTLFDPDNLHLNNAGHRAVADIYELADYTPYTGGVTPTVLIRKGRKFVLNATPTPPEDDEQLIIDTFDNVYFIKNALNRAGTEIQDGQLIDEVPNSKGSSPLISSESVSTPRTEIMKFNSKMGGLVNLDNENIFSLLNPNNITITAPCEVHFTGLQTSFFPFEAYINIYGLYMGEFGGGFRFTNGNTSDVTISPAAFPTGEAFHVRLLFNADKTVSCYLNNILLGTKNTYFTGQSGFLQRLGLGTDTNNAKWFSSSLAHCNRQLTTEEATNVYNAFKNIYSVDEIMPYPYIQNVGISYNSSTVTATGNYYSPTSTLENISLRKYRWYKAGNNSGAPDVTNNTRVPELDDLQSWSKTTFASLLATDIWFRVDIECTDNDNIGLGSASGCAYVKVV